MLVFLGDHQPAPIVTGTNASRDVPITIVAKDPAVLDKVGRVGLAGRAQAGPAGAGWRMDAFRDQFLTTFSG